MSPKKQPQYNRVEEISIKFTEWIGTPESIIVHTFFFLGIFALRFVHIEFSSILLILTTVVSLEAIYLAIFIQMSINRNTKSLEAVEEDVEEIAKDVDEIQEDVEGIEEDIDEIQEDVQGIEEDIDEIQEDVDEIQEDEMDEQRATELIEKVESQLAVIMKEIEQLKKRQK